MRGSFRPYGTTGLDRNIGVVTRAPERWRSHRHRGLAPRRQSRIRRRPVMEERNTRSSGWTPTRSRSRWRCCCREAGRPVEWQNANEPRAVRRLAKRLKREAWESCGSATRRDPCGYALQRQLRAAGGELRRGGALADPGKARGADQDGPARCAEAGAEMLRAGMLTEVQPPTPEEEAVRDLCRCREDMRARTCCALAIG